jgi:hypothetical protein
MTPVTRVFSPSFNDGERLKQIIALAHQITVDKPIMMYPLESNPVMFKSRSGCGSKLNGRSRSVRFATDLTHIIPTISRNDMTDEEYESCWWTQTEHDEASNKAKALILYTRKQGKNFVRKTLDCAFEISVNVSQRQIGESSSVMGDLEVKASKHLKNWIVHCDARRGLEKYLSQHPLKTRIVFDHREAVLSFSAAHHSPDEIALISRQCSATSQVHARMMGLGDEFFVKRCS